MDSKLPPLVGSAQRPLRLCVFGILLATSCSRYPNAEAAQAHVAGERALRVSAEKHVPNLDPGLLSRWNQLVQETIEQSARERRVVLIINKHRHTLSAYKNGYRVAEYDVDPDPNAGPRRLCEDGAMTEGKYQIVNKFGPGETAYQRAFVINCPNAHDRRSPSTLERHSGKRLKFGGNITIHGAIHQDHDRTAAGFTIDNEALDELFPYVGIGTPVTIVAHETVQSERKHRPGQ